jgi:TolA-binding protein
MNCWVWVLFLGAVLLMSCAGSREDALVVDDETFEGESATGASGEAQSSDEAEVLSLLGITKELDETESDATPDSTPDSIPDSGTSTNIRELESKIQNLEQETQKKNLEMTNLKAELAERDRRIADLRKELSSPSPYAESESRSTGVPATFQTRYDEALAIYNNRQYQRSITMFDELIALNVSNSLVDNCQYWKGECYYGLGDYNQAIIEFQKVFMYNDSNKLDDAQLKLGLCYIQLGDSGMARSELEKLLSNYPDSEYVGIAQSYLSRL